MTADNPRVDLDERLLEEALVVIRGARRREPADFLIAIGVLLAALAGVLLVAGALVPGSIGSLATNLAVEVIGALLTVVLVDGLWARLQSDASRRLQELERDLEVRARSTRPLDARERAGWSSVVADYAQLTAPRGVVARLRAMRAFRAQAQALVTRAEDLVRADGNERPLAQP